MNRVLSTRHPPFFITAMGKSTSLTSISVSTSEELGSVLEVLLRNFSLIVYNRISFGASPELLSWFGSMGLGEVICRELSIGGRVSARGTKENRGEWNQNGQSNGRIQRLSLLVISR